MFGFLSKRKADLAIAHALYRTIVTRSRHEDLYARLGVPDTFDGRFEMLVLHAALVLSRLRETGEADLAQRVFDIMFDDMDQALRESGVGDLAVPRRIRPMAEAFYGRAAAYRAGLRAEGGLSVLAEALGRNVFPDGCPDGVCDRLARYAASLDDVLTRADAAQIRNGEIRWPEPAGGEPA